MRKANRAKHKVVVTVAVTVTVATVAVTVTVAAVTVIPVVPVVVVVAKLNKRTVLSNNV